MAKVDRLVDTYVKIRDKRSEVKRDYELVDAPLKQQLETIEQALLEICADIGTDGLKTPFGTASRRIKTRYWAPNWDEFKEFVMAHLEDDALALMEKRISQGMMKQFLEENPTANPPINTDSSYAITVRRSTK